MKSPVLALIPFLALIGLAACLPLLTPVPPLASSTPPPATETSTPTIVWFPPTPTFTPLPTATLSITPTLDTRPRYGGLILEDDFSDPTLWMLGRVPAGNMTLGVKELSLVVSKERGYLFSLRQEISLDDFYLEITASPSICRGADEYGLLLRVSPSLEFFRFGLTCDGRARVDRLLSGQASSPQPPTISGAVPPGGPSVSRLAVWAVGKEMRFYANNEYLFSVRDPSLPAGSLGVFVRATGDDSVTVNFSDLSVYEAVK